MPNLTIFLSYYWTWEYTINILFRDFLSKGEFDTPSSVLQEILEVFQTGIGDKSV